MRSGKRRALTWVLSAAAFVIVVSAAGCARMLKVAGCRDNTPQPGPSPAVAPVSPDLPNEPAPDPLAIQLVRNESQPPTINVFGEFDGVERPAPSGLGKSGLQQHTYLDEGYDGDVAVDPKGQWLVFSSTRHSQHTDIYLQRIDGLSVTQLTCDEADDAFPVFSPDGSRIAFCSTRAGNWDIYVMDADGKNIVQTTSSPAHEVHPSFSPDGTRLVYCALGNRSGQWELWIVNLLTGEKRVIGPGLFPAWSPVKDQIAFQRARARGSRWFSLWTLDLVDGEARRVTEVAVSSNAAIVCPSWSPDGTRLSFATIVEPARSDSGKPQGQQDVWVINADGTNRRRLTDGNGASATPFWASNGRVYFVSNRGGTESIWSVKAEQSSVSTADAN